MKKIMAAIDAIGEEMMKPLHELTDNEKNALLDEMERLGLLRRDESGRTWLTERGNHFGCMLLTLKTIDKAVRRVGYPGAH
jgi:hypothetical protein